MKLSFKKFMPLGLALLFILLLSGNAMSQKASYSEMNEYLNNPSTVKNFAHIAHSSYGLKDYTVAKIDNNTIRYRIVYSVMAVSSITCVYDIHFVNDRSLGGFRVDNVSVVTEGSVKSSFRTYLWLNDDKCAKYYYSNYYNRFGFTWEELSDRDKAAILLTIGYMI